MALHYPAMRFAATQTIWISSDWYWRLAEDTVALTSDEAARCFVRPLFARLERGGDVVASHDALTITFEQRETRIALAGNVSDRIAIHYLIRDLNRILADGRVALAFAILVPRRYEVCGALLTAEELGHLYGDPMLLVPLSRRSTMS